MSLLLTARFLACSGVAFSTSRNAVKSFWLNHVNFLASLSRVTAFLMVSLEILDLASLFGFHEATE